MKHSWSIQKNGSVVDLEWFVDWRPWLWTAPIAHALSFLGDLHGKSVLEIGGKNARMSSLFALLGAKVTMVDVHISQAAYEVVAKWGVGGQVRFVQSKGMWEELGGERFDVVFTKSVLWCLIDQPAIIARINHLLAPGGKCAFVENYRGGKIYFLLREMLGGTGPNRHLYKGISHQQLDLFRAQFADLQIRRHNYIVWEIFGHKRKS
jgi:2-polyprenyl-3-methyl-5-hydroxy-6-metoxy-1,4-benzoquinol methylase